MSSDEWVDIGEVVEASGVPTSTLHVWERHGLIRPVGRAGLRRQYTLDVLERIAVIVVCQRSGFTLDEIATMLGPHATHEGQALLDQKLDELRTRRDEMDQAITGIEHAIACTAPNFIECDGFRTHLSGVLPVTDRRPAGSHPSV